MDHYDVVIVGSGRASGRTVTALRERGFAGTVLLVGEKPILPGNPPARPHNYRLGSIVIERMRADGTGSAMAPRVDVARGVAVTALDMQARTVTLDDGRRIGFGRCIVASCRRAASPRLRASGRSPG